MPDRHDWTEFNLPDPPPENGSPTQNWLVQVMFIQHKMLHRMMTGGCDGHKNVCKRVAAMEQAIQESRKDMGKWNTRWDQWSGVVKFAVGIGAVVTCAITVIQLLRGVKVL